MDAVLSEAVARWNAWDENESTRAEIAQLSSACNYDELRRRLGARMEFGTAGLRAAMGAGFSRMNELTVLQAAQGLCAYLLDVFGDACRTRGVVLGFDGRHNSKHFAEVSAAVFTSKGVRVYLHSRVVPTPLVAFSVLHLRTVAGVMVTASHNPKQDNGYKVYWDNGCQIVSPHDKGISAQIDANQKPWFSVRAQVATLVGHALLVDSTDECFHAYADAITADLCVNRSRDVTGAPRICYTAMHGVGYPYVAEVFRRWGLPELQVVAAQQWPDPEFPTVVFPNPQEGRGALELALRLAEERHCDLILANDPDADRLAVAVRQRPGGDFVILNGNEIGYLFADWALRVYKSRGGDVARAAMVCSTVSSKFLARMASVDGFHFEETLTGFKWMGNRIVDLKAKGMSPLFAYEEAIGYLVGSNVYDKDGVSAAAVFAEMACDLHANKSSVYERLQQLYAQYGYFKQNDNYFLCYEPEVIRRVFERIRALYRSSRALGAFRIARVRDLTDGFDDGQPDNKPILPVSKSSQMVTFYFENGCIATLRTSGTEPKIKYYIELSGGDGDRARVDAELAAVSAAIVSEYLQPSANGLLPPPS